MRCSIIIPTYNRANSLRRCLAAVMSVDYGDYEVIVVDDGSADGTERVVKHEFSRVRYVRLDENRGEWVARNRAIRLATGDLYAFTDDDCVVRPDWLGRHVAHFADPRVGAVGGPLVQRSPNFYDRFDLLHSGQLYGAMSRVESLDGWEALITGNMSVSRAVLDQVGEFDERFVNGGDVDLVRRVSRAGYVFVRDPALSVEHLKSHTFASLLRERFRKASGSIATDAKEGTVQMRRFIPVPNPIGFARSWRSFRRQFGGSPVTSARYLALSFLVRWTEVAGRAYYYRTRFRRGRRHPATPSVAEPGSPVETR